MPKIGMEKIRRKQVIDSVLTCVAREGVDKVTLEKTASNAGISKGVVAYYFKNKENLLFQSFKSFLLSYLEFDDDNYDGLSAREMLLLVGKSVLGLIPSKGELSQSDIKIILMQIYSRLSLSSEYKDMVRTVYDQYLDGMEKILSLGKTNNEFVVEDTRNAAVQLMAMLDGLIIYSILDFQGSSDDQFGRYADFINRL